MHYTTGVVHFFCPEFTNLKVLKAANCQIYEVIDILKKLLLFIKK
jgi:hypothetical protein